MATSKKLPVGPVSSASEQCSHPFKVGQPYFIRTVTHHYTGKLVSVHDKEIVITDAAWIADDGRFNEAVKDGSGMNATDRFKEVEPYPDGVEVIIGRGAILDMCSPPNFALPRSMK